MEERKKERKSRKKINKSIEPPYDVQCTLQEPSFQHAITTCKQTSSVIAVHTAYTLPMATLQVHFRSQNIQISFQ